MLYRCTRMATVGVKGLMMPLLAQRDVINPVVHSDTTDQ